MKIFIRADGGEEIGLGHIMRTLVLAMKLKINHSITYICLNYKGFEKGIAVIENSKLNVVKIQKEKEVFNYSGDLIIVDKYSLDKEYYKNLKSFYKKVVSIDDNNELDFYYSDIVINQNLYAPKLQYNCSSTTELLLGSRYALLRDEFVDERPIVIRKEIKDILVTLGGSDRNNITEKVIKELIDSRYKLHIIVGNGFTSFNELKKYSGENITLYRKVKMSKVMKKCDFAISAYGSTIYELCYLGLPSLGIISADNQKRLGEELNSNGIVDKFIFGKIESQIKDMNYEKRVKLSKAMRSIVDGKGAERVLVSLEENIK